MKSLKMWLVAILAVSGILCAEGVDIPVLWRNPAAEVQAGQLQAFGFWENESRVVLAFQIKELPTMIETPKAYMSFYADADDNLATGRYPNNLGWDFQINMILTRKAVLSLLKYTDDATKAKELSRAGSKVISQDDVLFVNLPKSALDGIEFKGNFKFRTLQLKNNQRVDKEKADGVFPVKFEIPSEN